MLTGEEASLLNQIYDFNPLLFDFMLKQCVKVFFFFFPSSFSFSHPQNKGPNGEKFPKSMFLMHKDLQF